MNGGRSWASAGLAQPPDRYGSRTGVYPLEVDPRTPGTVYAGLNVRWGLGLFKSTDGGSSWQPLTDGLDAGVDAIALDPRDPEAVYVGSLGGQGSVFRSTDGGTSRQRADSGLPRLRVKTDAGKWITQAFGVNALAIDPVHPTTLYAAAFGHGVYRSTDSGRSWRPLNAGGTLYAGTSGGGVASLHPGA